MPDGIKTSSLLLTATTTTHSNGPLPVNGIAAHTCRYPSRRLTRRIHAHAERRLRLFGISIPCMRKRRRSYAATGKDNFRHIQTGRHGVFGQQCGCGISRRTFHTRLTAVFHATRMLPEVARSQSTGYCRIEGGKAALLPMRSCWHTSGLYVQHFQRDGARFLRKMRYYRNRARIRIGKSRRGENSRMPALHKILARILPETRRTGNTERTCLFTKRKDTYEGRVRLPQVRYGDISREAAHRPFDVYCPLYIHHMY